MRDIRKNLTLMAVMDFHAVSSLEEEEVVASLMS